MKIITRAVIDWATLKVEECDSHDYEGPIALAKSSGSAPNPTNPYEQAASEYGLATGTADYNAALNRTNSQNPLGGSTWQVTGTDGTGPGEFGGYPTSFSAQNGAGGASATDSSAYGGSTPGLGYDGAANYGGIYGLGSNQSGSGYTGSGAPIYTQTTSLGPQYDSMLSTPINTSNMPGVGQAIDTSQIPGMPGGLNVSQNDLATQNAEFQSEMGYLAPEEALAGEQTQSQLEAEGAMPGSAAYNTGESQLARNDTFQNTQAADQAIQMGNQEEQTLYGLGSESLQNQLGLGSTELQNTESARMAPISEYDALNGGASTPVSAATPDIAGAFNQQYQGALAGYNANVASNNATTSALGGLASAGILGSASSWAPALAALF